MPTKNEKLRNILPIMRKEKLTRYYNWMVFVLVLHTEREPYRLSFLRNTPTHVGNTATEWSDNKKSKHLISA